MRDPQRIDRILKKLEYEWKKYPDLRLGQLIANLMFVHESNGEFMDVFFYEDWDLENALNSGGIPPGGDLDD